MKTNYQAPQIMVVELEIEDAVRQTSDFGVGNSMSDLYND